MAQAFGGVGGEVENIIELVALEYRLHKLRIRDGPRHQLRAFIHVLPKTAGQVVERHHLVAVFQKFIDHVAADEAGASGN